MNAPVFTLPLPDISPWRAGNCGVEGVWQFDSGRPGRHVMISALVHGNEICGAWALTGLLEALHRQDGTALKLAQGKLTLVFANLAAFDRFDPARHDASRFVDEDLNRQWIDARIDAADTRERRRASELRPFVRQADWLLDLHSMHEPCAPLLLTGVQPRNRTLAQQLGAPGHIVIDAGHKDGTRLRDYGRFGLPDEQAPDTRSLLIECGFHGDPASREVARDQCARFLQASRLVTPDTLAAALPGWRGADAPEQWALTVTEPVVAKSSHFHRRRTRAHALRPLRTRHAVGATSPCRRHRGALCPQAGVAFLVRHPPPIFCPHCRIQRAPDAEFSQAADVQPALAQVFGERPVRQGGDAALAGDLLDDDGGEFGLAHRRRFNAHGIEKHGKDVQTLALHRVGNQHLIAQLLGGHETALRQRAGFGHRQHQFIAKERQIAYRR